MATDIRLNSLEYTQLTERITAPLRKARDVIIHQSLSDQFLLAFEAQVQENGRHILPPDAPVSNPHNSATPCSAYLRLKWLVGSWQ